MLTWRLGHEREEERRRGIPTGLLETEVRS